MWVTFRLLSQEIRHIFLGTQHRGYIYGEAKKLMLKSRCTSSAPRMVVVLCALFFSGWQYLCSPLLSWSARLDCTNGPSRARRCTPCKRSSHESAYLAMFRNPNLSNFSKKCWSRPPFLRQSTSHLQRCTSLASKPWRKGSPTIHLPFALQYASYLYGNTPPTCTAILLRKH